MSSVPVVLGLTANQQLLLGGLTTNFYSSDDDTQISTASTIPVQQPATFEAESWSGEHAERENDDASIISLSFEHPHLHHQDTTDTEDDTPIASSIQFERARSASLAAALLNLDPKGVPLVHFFHPTVPQVPLLEGEEDNQDGENQQEGSHCAAFDCVSPSDSVGEVEEAEKILSTLLFTLRALQMTDPKQHSIAVRRLKDLEAELRAAGAVTPADPVVSEAVARALAAANPGRDVQIRVNQSRHTTTTKTIYETETPGMVGLDSDKIRELHQQMLDSLTSATTDTAADAGTTQKKETAEEGFTNEDGSVVVSKKMTRVVTTTRTTLPGDSDEAQQTIESAMEEVGSVRDRIARFESLKQDTSPSASEQTANSDETDIGFLRRRYQDAEEPLTASSETVLRAEVKQQDYCTDTTVNNNVAEEGHETSGLTHSGHESSAVEITSNDNGENDEQNFVKQNFDKTVSVEKNTMEIMSGGNEIKKRSFSEQEPEACSEFSEFSLLTSHTEKQLPTQISLIEPEIHKVEWVTQNFEVTVDETKGLASSEIREKSSDDERKLDKSKIGPLISTSPYEFTQPGASLNTFETDQHVIDSYKYEQNHEDDQREDVTSNRENELDHKIDSEMASHTSPQTFIDNRESEEFAQMEQIFTDNIPYTVSHVSSQIHEHEREGSSSSYLGESDYTETVSQTPVTSAFDDDKDSQAYGPTPTFEQEIRRTSYEDDELNHPVEASDFDNQMLDEHDDELESGAKSAFGDKALNFVKKAGVLAGAAVVAPVAFAAVGGRAVYDFIEDEKNETSGRTLSECGSQPSSHIGIHQTESFVETQSNKDNVNESICSDQSHQVLESTSTDGEGVEKNEQPHLISSEPNVTFNTPPLSSRLGQDDSVHSVEEHIPSVLETDHDVHEQRDLNSPSTEEKEVVDDYEVGFVSSEPTVAHESSTQSPVSHQEFTQLTDSVHSVEEPIPSVLETDHNVHEQRDLNSPSTEEKEVVDDYEVGFVSSEPAVAHESSTQSPVSHQEFTQLTDSVHSVEEPIPSVLDTDLYVHEQRDLNSPSTEEKEVVNDYEVGFVSSEPTVAHESSTQSPVSHQEFTQLTDSVHSVEEPIPSVLETDHDVHEQRDLNSPSTEEREVVDDYEVGFVSSEPAVAHESSTQSPVSHQEFTQLTDSVHSVEEHIPSVLETDHDVHEQRDLNSPSTEEKEVVDDYEVGFVSSEPAVAHESSTQSPVSHQEFTQLTDSVHSVEEHIPSVLETDHDVHEQRDLNSPSTEEKEVVDDYEVGFVSSQPAVAHESSTQSPVSHQEFRPSIDSVHSVEEHIPSVLETDHDVHEQRDLNSPSTEEKEVVDDYEVGFVSSEPTVAHESSTQSPVSHQEFTQLTDSVHSVEEHIPSVLETDHDVHEQRDLNSPSTEEKEVVDDYEVGFVSSEPAVAHESSTQSPVSHQEFRQSIHFVHSVEEPIPSVRETDHDVHEQRDLNSPSTDKKEVVDDYEVGFVSSEPAVAHESSTQSPVSHQQLTSEIDKILRENLNSPSVGEKNLEYEEDSTFKAENDQENIREDIIVSEESTIVPRTFEENRKQSEDFETYSDVIISTVHENITTEVEQNNLEAQQPNPVEHASERSTDSVIISEDITSTDVAIDFSTMEQPNVNTTLIKEEDITQKNDSSQIPRESTMRFDSSHQTSTLEETTDETFVEKTPIEEETIRDTSSYETTPTFEQEIRRTSYENDEHNHPVGASDFDNQMLDEHDDELESGAKSAFGDKALDFVKKAGVLAGAAVVAPVAFAAVGARAVYDFIEDERNETSGRTLTECGSQPSSHIGIHQTETFVETQSNKDFVNESIYSDQSHQVLESTSTDREGVEKNEQPHLISSEPNVTFNTPPLSSRLGQDDSVHSIEEPIKSGLETDADVHEQHDINSPWIEEKEVVDDYEVGFVSSEPTVAHESSTQSPVSHQEFTQPTDSVHSVEEQIPSGLETDLDIHEQRDVNSPSTEDDYEVGFVSSEPTVAHESSTQSPVSHQEFKQPTDSVHSVEEQIPSGLETDLDIHEQRDVNSPSTEDDHEVGFVSSEPTVAHESSTQSPVSHQEFKQPTDSVHSVEEQIPSGLETDLDIHEQRDVNSPSTEDDYEVGFVSSEPTVAHESSTQSPVSHQEFKQPTDSVHSVEEQIPSGLETDLDIHEQRDVNSPSTEDDYEVGFVSSEPTVAHESSTQSPVSHQEFKQPTDSVHSVEEQIPSGLETDLDIHEQRDVNSPSTEDDHEVGFVSSEPTVAHESSTQSPVSHQEFKQPTDSVHSVEEQIPSGLETDLDIHEQRDVNSPSTEDDHEVGFVSSEPTVAHESSTQSPVSHQEFRPSIDSVHSVEEHIPSVLETDLDIHEQRDVNSPSTEDDHEVGFVSSEPTVAHESSTQSPVSHQEFRQSIHFVHSVEEPIPSVLETDHDVHEQRDLNSPSTDKKEVVDDYEVGFVSSEPAVAHESSTQSPVSHQQLTSEIDKILRENLNSPSVGEKNLEYEEDSTFKAENDQENIREDIIVSEESTIVPRTFEENRKQSEDFETYSDVIISTVHENIPTEVEQNNLEAQQPNPVEHASERSTDSVIISEDITSTDVAIDFSTMEQPNVNTTLIKEEDITQKNDSSQIPRESTMRFDSSHQTSTLEETTDETFVEKTPIEEETIRDTSSYETTPTFEQEIRRTSYENDEHNHPVGASDFDNQMLDEHDDELESGAKSAFGDKALDFVKKAGVLAGAAVVAPVAFAAVGARAVYDFIEDERNETSGRTLTECGSQPSSHIGIHQTETFVETQSNKDFVNESIYSDQSHQVLESTSTDGEGVEKNEQPHLISSEPNVRFNTPPLSSRLGQDLSSPTNFVAGHEKHLESSDCIVEVDNPSESSTFYQESEKLLREKKIEEDYVRVENSSEPTVTIDSPNLSPRLNQEFQQTFDSVHSVEKHIPSVLETDLDVHEQRDRNSPTTEEKGKGYDQEVGSVSYELYLAHESLTQSPVSHQQLTSEIDKILREDLNSPSVAEKNLEYEEDSTFKAENDQENIREDIIVSEESTIVPRTFEENLKQSEDFETYSDVIISTVHENITTEVEQNNLEAQQPNPVEHASERSTDSVIISEDITSTDVAIDFSAMEQPNVNTTLIKEEDITQKNDSSQIPRESTMRFDSSHQTSTLEETTDETFVEKTPIEEETIRDTSSYETTPTFEQEIRRTSYENDEHNHPVGASDFDNQMLDEHDDELESGAKSAFGDKALDFVKKAGVLAGAAVVAPVAFAAVGARAVYDFIEDERNETSGRTLSECGSQPSSHIGIHQTETFVETQSNKDFVNESIYSDQSHQVLESTSTDGEGVEKNEQPHLISSEPNVTFNTPPLSSRLEQDDSVHSIEEPIKSGLETDADVHEQHDINSPWTEEKQVVDDYEVGFVSSEPAVAHESSTQSPVSHQEFKQPTDSVDSVEEQIPPGLETDLDIHEQHDINSPWTDKKEVVDDYEVGFVSSEPAVARESSTQSPVSHQEFRQSIDSVHPVEEPIPSVLETDLDVHEQRDLNSPSTEEKEVVDNYEVGFVSSEPTVAYESSTQSPVSHQEFKQSTDSVDSVEERIPSGLETDADVHEQRDRNSPWTEKKEVVDDYEVGFVSSEPTVAHESSTQSPVSHQEFTQLTDSVHSVEEHIPSVLETDLDVHEQRDVNAPSTEDDHEVGFVSSEPTVAHESSTQSPVSHQEFKQSIDSVHSVEEHIPSVLETDLDVHEQRDRNSPWTEKKEVVDDYEVGFVSSEPTVSHESSTQSPVSHREFRPSIDSVHSVEEHIPSVLETDLDVHEQRDVNAPSTEDDHEVGFVSSEPTVAHESSTQSPVSHQEFRHATDSVHSVEEHIPSVLETDLDVHEQRDVNAPSTEDDHEVGFVSSEPTVAHESSTQLPVSRQEFKQPTDSVHSVEEQIPSGLETDRDIHEQQDINSPWTEKKEVVDDYEVGFVSSEPTVAHESSTQSPVSHQEFRQLTDSVHSVEEQIPSVLETDLDVHEQRDVNAPSTEDDHEVGFVSSEPTVAHESSTQSPVSHQEFRQLTDSVHSVEEHIPSVLGTDLDVHEQRDVNAPSTEDDHEVGFVSSEPTVAHESSTQSPVSHQEFKQQTDSDHSVEEQIPSGLETDLYIHEQRDVNSPSTEDDHEVGFVSSEPTVAHESSTQSPVSHQEFRQSIDSVHSVEEHIPSVLGTDLDVHEQRDVNASSTEDDHEVGFVSSEPTVAHESSTQSPVSHQEFKQQTDSDHSVEEQIPSGLETDLYIHEQRDVNSPSTEDDHEVGFVSSEPTVAHESSTQSPVSHQEFKQPTDSVHSVEEQIPSGLETDLDIHEQRDVNSPSTEDDYEVGFVSSEPTVAHESSTQSPVSHQEFKQPTDSVHSVEEQIPSGLETDLDIHEQRDVNSPSTEDDHEVGFVSSEPTVAHESSTQSHVSHQEFRQSIDSVHSVEEHIPSVLETDLDVHEQRDVNAPSTEDDHEVGFVSSEPTVAHESSTQSPVSHQEFRQQTDSDHSVEEQIPSGLETDLYIHEQRDVNSPSTEDDHEVGFVSSEPTVAHESSTQSPVSHQEFRQSIDSVHSVEEHIPSVLGTDLDVHEQRDVNASSTKDDHEVGFVSSEPTVAHESSTQSPVSHQEFKQQTDSDHSVEEQIPSGLETDLYIHEQRDVNSPSTEDDHEVGFVSSEPTVAHESSTQSHVSHQEFRQSIDSVHSVEEPIPSVLDTDLYVREQRDLNSPSTEEKEVVNDYEVGFVSSEPTVAHESSTQSPVFYQEFRQLTDSVHSVEEHIPSVLETDLDVHEQRNLSSPSTEDEHSNLVQVRNEAEDNPSSIIKQSSLRKTEENDQMQTTEDSNGSSSTKVKSPTDKDFDELTDFEKILEENTPVNISERTSVEVQILATKLEEDDRSRILEDTFEDTTSETFYEDKMRKASLEVERKKSLQDLVEEAFDNVNRMKFNEELELVSSPDKHTVRNLSSLNIDESTEVIVDEEWKVFDNRGLVVEDFSIQLTEQVMTDVSNETSSSRLSNVSLSKQESCNEVTVEPEIDYQSDLQEKLDILASQSRVQLSFGRDDEQLDVIHESDFEKDHQDSANRSGDEKADEMISEDMEQLQNVKHRSKPDNEFEEISQNENNRLIPEETEEGFIMYSHNRDDEDGDGELETVEEEPEDSDSVNGSGNSSVGAPSETLAMLGKYRHVSSDNVSLNSLQEFERLEQIVDNRGENSLTSSEIELYSAARLRSSEGSVNSLAEFEKLEQDIASQGVNNLSPQEEMMLSVVKEESEAEEMSTRDDEEFEQDHDLEIGYEVSTAVKSISPENITPADSLEHINLSSENDILETSTDSLEPIVMQEQQIGTTKLNENTVMETSIDVYEVISENLRDSLENITHERDSLLEGASQDMASQDTRGMLSGDTVGTYQEHDDDKDSLGGELDNMLASYPSTLTTFETTALDSDGTIKKISRRVETRVRDPVNSHVAFTGTENEERLLELPPGEQIETVDSEGNVTRTTISRQTANQH